MFYILFYILYSIFYILYSIFSILYSLFYILYSLFSILLSLFYDLYSIFYMILYIFKFIQNILIPPPFFNSLPFTDPPNPSPPPLHMVLIPLPRSRPWSNRHPLYPSLSPSPPPSPLYHQKMYGNCYKSF